MRGLFVMNCVVHVALRHLEKHGASWISSPWFCEATGLALKS